MERYSLSPFLNPDLWLERNHLAVVVDQPGAYSQSPGHCLIVPRREIASVWELDRSEWEACRELMWLAKQRIAKAFRPTGYNIKINEGKSAGQRVFHVHIHLIPRYGK